MKFSPFNKLASVILIAVVLSACSEINKPTESAVPKTVSVDSLNNAWKNAWNNHDVNAISNMFASNSVVMAGDWKVVGKDSITENWIKRNAPIITNLTTTSYTEGATADMAFFAGAYNLDMLRNDSIIGSRKGVFTCIWETQADKSWKVSLFQLEEFSE